MIILDRRVGSAELEKPLKRLGVTVEVMTLEYGDVMWEGKGPEGSLMVGVERKTIGDLMSSIVEGRLAGHQIPGMALMYDCRYLLVEGIFRPSDEGLLEYLHYKKWLPVGGGRQKFMYRQYAGFINTVLLQEGIQEIRTQDERETAHRLFALYQHWQKPWEAHRSLKAFNTVDSTRVLARKPRLAACVAKELPGIGWDKAKAASRHFGTVWAMANGQACDWEQVEGVGPKTAERVVRAIRSK